MQYNDHMVRFIADNWGGVIQECVEQKVFPTVLFYEKLLNEEEDAKYDLKKEFTQTSRDISKLVTLAGKVERDNEENTNFSQADIEEQYKIQQALQQKQIEKEKPVKDSPNKGSPPYMIYWCDGAEGEAISCKVMNYKTKREAE